MMTDEEAKAYFHETPEDKKARAAFDKEWSRQFEKAHGQTFEQSVQERYGEVESNQAARERRIKNWEWLTENILPYGILITDITFRVLQALKIIS